MTADEFRRPALDLPETCEAAHMNHPDFRVAGKIFATLGWPDTNWGMAKLIPEQQAACVTAAPHTFVSVKGAWGRRGATKVCLAAVTVTTLRPALLAAWRNAAPPRLTGTREVE